MDTPSLNLDSNEPAGRPARTSGTQGGGLISDGVKTVLIFVLIAAVGYLLVDNYRSQQKNTAELAKIGALDTRVTTASGRTLAALTWTRVLPSTWPAPTAPRTTPGATGG